MNRAAIISEGDVKPDGCSTSNRWRLCSVQEVEDFKTLIKILPLWSSSFFLGTTIGVQLSFSVLQALSCLQENVSQQQHPSLTRKR